MYALRDHAVEMPRHGALPRDKTNIPTEVEILMQGALSIEKSNRPDEMEIQRFGGPFV